MPSRMANSKTNVSSPINCSLDQTSNSESTNPDFFLLQSAQNEPLF